MGGGAQLHQDGLVTEDAVTFLTTLCRLAFTEVFLFFCCKLLDLTLTTLFSLPTHLGGFEGGWGCVSL